ncbi:nickel pincer cofactor biosynthesis protein LarC [Streptomyces sp. NPDC005374]|uniref:nickel pincer cofactor biosynthesis protein LarC n=1 Tax=Streptomyces sp. NPDC005374 TaxID=3364713 RepID=UPI0036C1A9F3
MRTLWIDAANGAAGDMLLAALLDAGADRDAVDTALAGLPVEPISLAEQDVRRHGFRAKQVVVTAPETTTRRNLDDVLAVVAAAGLPPKTAGFATDVFRRLARAEARVHGIPVTQVHFHEVGALDAIVDVVGCATALQSLDLLGQVTCVVGPIAVGAGVVSGAHGAIPIPGPAVLELLAAAGAPVAAHTAAMELCTPTGAALLCTLATGWGPPPALTPVAVGVGAGTADPPTHPNVLRVLIGESAAEPEWATSPLHRVDTTVDDLDPRLWPDLLDGLRSVGAADAWCTPALTRKGRPGQVLSVLVDDERLDLVCGVVFEQTTTLGVRVSPVSRRALRRDQVEVQVDGSAVQVKRGYLAGRIVTVQPEYDEALEAARRTGLPVATVLERARILGGEAGP